MFITHICIPICAYAYPFVCVHIVIHKLHLCANMFVKCGNIVNKNPKKKNIYYINTWYTKKKKYKKRSMVHLNRTRAKRTMSRNGGMITNMSDSGHANRERFFTAPKSRHENWKSKRAKIRWFYSLSNVPCAKQLQTKRATVITLFLPLRFSQILARKTRQPDWVEISPKAARM